MTRASLRLALPILLPPAMFAAAAGLPAAAGANPGYVRSDVGAPWGSTTNEEAMDLQFGVGGWDDLRYETVDVVELLSPSYTFLYLEGSDSNALELEAFLQANQAALEAWVSAGGTLFVNAAPNEGGAQDWGFGGVVLNYVDTNVNPGSAVDAAHPIWNGPFLPTSPDSFTANFFAHATVTGPGLVALIQDGDGGDPALAELPAWGNGHVIFGGLTTSNFWTPAPDALNLRANILAYLATTNCCEAHVDTGCTTPSCETTVCGIDSFCCATQWDGVCASLAFNNCPVCAECGDGTVTAGAEECDDVGESATCNADCTTAACGDGVLNVTAGEVCDDGGESATCDIDCTAAMCGDAVVNAAAGEACDDGAETATCNDDCTAAVCGDGMVNATAGETCDDGGRSATCNDDCTAVSCGDGVFNASAGEQCDDAGESAACDADCTNAMCGDMTVNATAGEDCDDGEQTATCNDDCTSAACGDGVLNEDAGEVCDDGNLEDGDGCAADCTVEEPGGDTGDTGDAGDDDAPADDTGGDDTGADTAGQDDDPADDDPGDAADDDDGDETGDQTGEGGSSGSATESGGCRVAPGDRRGAWTWFGALGLLGLGRRRHSSVRR